ncbi:MAG TPA: N-acetyltransferase [Desulfocapsa sulfexigens]|nr:N-acetyltransferase [Desulfocapsa sulfexigens]
MKIRSLTPDMYAKASALLREAFPGSHYEEQLVGNLHKNNKIIHDWACIHTNKVVAYIAFSKAYNGSEVCGLHLAPLAVKPEYQHQGIGSELLNFALRQNIIKESTLYVLGNPGFYTQFGFELCVNPICPYTKKNKNFLSIRNKSSAQFTVEYEPEFSSGI